MQQITKQFIFPHLITSCLWRLIWKVLLWLWIGQGQWTLCKQIWRLYVLNFSLRLLQSLCIVYIKLHSLRGCKWHFNLNSIELKHLVFKFTEAILWVTILFFVFNMIQIKLWYILSTTVPFYQRFVSHINHNFTQYGILYCTHIEGTWSV